MVSDRRGGVAGSPLHAAITGALDELDRAHDTLHCDSKECVHLAVRALRAVMAVHSPFTSGVLTSIEPDGTVRDLAIETPDGGYIYVDPPEIRCGCTPNGTLPDPCPTLVAIVRAMGIEAPRDRP